MLYISKPSLSFSQLLSICKVDLPRYNFHPFIFFSAIFSFRYFTLANLSTSRSGMSCMSAFLTFLLFFLFPSAFFSFLSSYPKLSTSSVLSALIVVTTMNAETIVVSDDEFVALNALVRNALEHRAVDVQSVEFSNYPYDEAWMGVEQNGDSIFTLAQYTGLPYQEPESI